MRYGGVLKVHPPKPPVPDYNIIYTHLSVPEFIKIYEYMYVNIYIYIYI
jgi:hypothetical protein